MQLQFLCSYWWAVCRSKHVEQLRNNEWEPLSHDSCRPPQTFVKREAAITIFELLMMSGVSLETCWAIKKHWNNKFYYTVASCWLFLYDNQIVYLIPHINREAWGSIIHENWRLWITSLSNLYHWRAQAKGFLKNLLRGTWFGLRKRSQRLLPSLSENDDVQVTNKSDTSNSGTLLLANCTVKPEATNQ